MAISHTDAKGFGGRSVSSAHAKVGQCSPSTKEILSMAGRFVNAEKGD
jgi:hypothetical protein